MKLFLTKVRWGKALTQSDLEVIEQLSFLDLFRSSYLTAKTLRVKTSSTILPR